MLNAKVAPSDGRVDVFYYHTFRWRHLKKVKHLFICVQNDYQDAKSRPFESRTCIYGTYSQSLVRANCTHTAGLSKCIPWV